MGRLDGKVALVTGAARGIGAACAQVLAREGAKLLCTDVREDEGEAAVAALQATGGEAIFAAHDVTDEAAWERMAALAVKRFGALHILVNNAGVAPAGAPIEELTLESWRRTVAIDLDSVFLGCKYGIRTIKHHGGGSIVNISSIMGFVGLANAADYNASKGGVRILTKVAALECAEAKYNIRVNSVHPGYIDTPLVRSAVQKGAVLGHFGGANEGLEYLRMQHPIGRLGEPEDIAHAVLFLASDESSFVTGTELVVDGGYLAR